MGKVTDISKGCVAGYVALSRTPRDRNRGNFFLKELQDKYDAEWKYAPNVVGIEYETGWGTMEFAPIEVRDQKVHADKTKTYSDDVKRLAFRDIREKRFRIGSRFRFSERFDMDIPEGNRSIWLATNFTYSSPATSAVVTRCNGRLGSMETDPQGISNPHYEPVIFGGELKGVSVYTSETAFSPESELTAVMQHNEHTAKYYINQRFVVGYDQVYKVKGLNKFYSQNTNDPHDPGLMILYLEITEKSEKDDFETLIAYNESKDVIVESTPKPQGGESVPTIAWTLPEVFPSSLKSSKVRFAASPMQGGSEMAGISLQFSYELENLPEGVDPTEYVGFDVDGNSFVAWRKRQYMNGCIRIKAILPASEWGGDDDVVSTFSLRMAGL